MSLIAVHDDIIFLDDSYATDLVVVAFYLALTNMLLWMSMILLALDYMATQHLRILDLNLWIIKYIVIIIDILYNFDGLILVLLFRF